MRARLFIVLGLALSCPAIALGADPVVGTPAAERSEVTTPTEVPPVPVVNEKPKPLEKPRTTEKPKPVERPKPVEKPRIAAENPQSPDVVISKPVEPSPPAVVPAPTTNAVPGQSEARAGYSFGCLALAFAMLITGIAAGFLGRHLMSRHKLGGMTVRIGTWRGIP